MIRIVVYVEDKINGRNLIFSTLTKSTYSRTINEPIEFQFKIISFSNQILTFKFLDLNNRCTCFCKFYSFTQIL